MEDLDFEELSVIIKHYSKQWGIGGGISPSAIDRIALAAAAYQNKLRAIRAEMEKAA
jgi:hypothetical protein